jgi:hypothetical protein
MRLQYQIKWDAGDAEFTKQQSKPVFRHRYDVTGDKKISIQAIDPRWNTTHEVTRSVTVN